MTELIDRLVPLTDWGHVFRYPDLADEPVPSPEELRSVLSDIRRFADYAAGRSGSFSAGQETPGG